MHVAFLINVLDQVDIQRVKNEFLSLPYTIYKTQFQMSCRFNRVKHYTRRKHMNISLWP